MNRERNIRKNYSKCITRVSIGRLQSWLVEQRKILAERLNREAYRNAKKCGKKCIHKRSKLEMENLSIFFPTEWSDFKTELMTYQN